MLGNFTLIRENKEGADFKGGGPGLGAMAPMSPGPAGEGTRRRQDGVPLGSLVN